MSPSMVLGRVILPGVALAVAAAIGWQAYRTGRVELPPWAAGPVEARPATRPVAADGPRPVVAEGRVVAYPGSQVTVGAEVAGTIARVHVVEGSAVRKGAPLVSFQADDARAQLDEAVAQLAGAEAEVARAEADERRLLAALPKGATPSPDVERFHFLVVGERARRDALKAARARLDAQWRRHWAFAPIDGTVIARAVQPGETVGVASPLATVADLSRLRVEAEVDEYDLARVAVGRLATLRAEAFPGRSWRGVVEEVAEALVPRRLRPEDPGRPTDTRVLPVRIRLLEPTPLKLGQRVDVALAPTPADEPPSPTTLSTRPAGPVAR